VGRPGSSTTDAHRYMMAMAIAISAAPGGNSIMYASLSPARFASAGTPTRNNATGTVGSRFWPTFAGSCYGVEFYHVASGTETATVSLWRVTGSLLLAQASGSVSTTGVNTVSFASAVTLTPATKYVVGVYFTGVYTQMSTSFSVDVPTSSPWYGGAGIVYELYNLIAPSANTLPSINAVVRFGVGALLR
jgi:hypothetical protein